MNARRPPKEIKDLKPGEAVIIIAIEIAVAIIAGIIMYQLYK